MELQMVAPMAQYSETWSGDKMVYLMAEKSVGLKTKYLADSMVEMMVG